MYVFVCVCECGEKKPYTHLFILYIPIRPRARTHTRTFSLVRVSTRIVCALPYRTRSDRSLLVNSIRHRQPIRHRAVPAVSRTRARDIRLSNRPDPGGYARSRKYLRATTRPGQILSPKHFLNHGRVTAVASAFFRFGLYSFETTAAQSPSFARPAV